MCHLFLPEGFICSIVLEMKEKNTSCNDFVVRACQKSICIANRYNKPELFDVLYNSYCLKFIVCFQKKNADQSMLYYSRHRHLSSTKKNQKMDIFGKDFSRRKNFTHFSLIIINVE
jgi:hypothetical protein